MNIILWFILWSIVGWLCGILVYFTGGLLALAHSDDDLRNRVANYYSEQAMKLLGRAAIVERGTKYDIYRVTRDPAKNVDEFTIDGETAAVSNETGLLSTLHKRPLGLVPPPEDDVAVYVSPEVAEFGAIESQRREHNELRDEEGNYVEEVDVGWERPLVQLQEYAEYMIPGSRSLWGVDETVDLFRQSQSRFSSPNTTQYMVLIVAYCAAVLVMWLVMTNAGGAAPTGVSVPGIGG